MKYNILLLIVFLGIIFAEDKVKLIKDKKANLSNNNFNQEEIDEYMDLYERSFEKILEKYADNANPIDLIKDGIKGMMYNLDPYTLLLEGSSKDSYDLLRKGKYGGVGFSIGVRKRVLTVLSVMEDSPAYTEGILVGDQISMIDSTSTKGFTVKEAVKLIKGDVGSQVVLSIFRPSSREKIDFELTRDNIVVKHVPYWHIDDDGIGYIKVNRFSKNVSNDFKMSLLELDSEKFIDTNGNNKWDDEESYVDLNKNGFWDSDENYIDSNNNNKYDNAEIFIDGNNNNKYDKKGCLKGVVLDLRNNKGGLLSAAVKIVDSFTERGELILEQKGKISSENRVYKSRNKPLVSNQIPIAVLINKNSASASEIVAGALQDLDRAIIVGQKSYGKGMIQKMFDLNDSLTLKITTAKYYLPSGRLIQVEDYFKEGFLEKGLNEQDSLFLSKTGREFLGGGGVTPDILLENENIPPYVNALWNSGAFTTFAAEYIVKHPNVKDDLHISRKILRDFNNYLDSYDIQYTLKGEKELDKLKEQLKKTGLTSDKNHISFEEQKMIEEIEKYFDRLHFKQFSLNHNLKWIKNGLLREFSKVIYGNKEEIKASLYEDQEYEKAREILLKKKEYLKILNL